MTIDAGAQDASPVTVAAARAEFDPDVTYLVQHRLQVLARRPTPSLPPARGQLRQERYVIRSCM